MAVDSVRSAGEDVEIIVVDDASQDGTADVCRGLHGINYVRLEHNLGVAGARNVGLFVSRGEYLAFLDDDDLRLPGSLDRQVDRLLAVPDASFVYGRLLEADQEGLLMGSKVPTERFEGDLFWRLIEWCIIPPQAVVVRRWALARVGLLETSVARSDDWDLLIRLSEPFPVAFFDGDVAIWRKPSSSSDQGSADWASIVAILDRVQTRALRLPRASSATEPMRRTARRRFVERASDSLIWHAAEALEHGAYAAARRNLLYAFQLSPFRACHPMTLRLLARSLLGLKTSAPLN